MLTKFQQVDLEKAILGYCLSKEYYQSASALAQESEMLRNSDFITMKDKEGDETPLSQINLFFKGIGNMSATSSQNSSAYTDINVRVPCFFCNY
jgi:hypothetical protein